MRLRAVISTVCFLAAAIASGQTLPVKIAAGATVSIRKHVPTSNREIYTVTVSARQTLLVDLENTEGELQVLEPGATKPLPSVELAGPTDWMNVIAKPGGYQ